MDREKRKCYIPHEVVVAAKNKMNLKNGLSGKKNGGAPLGRNTPSRRNYHGLGGAATSSPKLYHSIHWSFYNSLKGNTTPQPGGSLLTPKADHYKHLVDHYKRTLEGLNTADHKNEAVKHTLDFLNRQH